MRSTWGKRGITASLLLSMLPLLVYPVIRDGSNASVNRYEDWLRIQFESASGDIVDRAIAAAKTVNADDPSVFLQAFVEAYNTFAGAGPLTLSNHALLGVFQFRLLRLVGNALIPHWILKSVQTRTILSQERIPSGLKAAVLASLPTPALEGEPMADAGIRLPVFSGLIPINPRAP